jgi:hypothetical protein
MSNSPIFRTRQRYFFSRSVPCTYFIKIGEELIQTLMTRKQDRLESTKTTSKHPNHPNYDLDDKATPDKRTKAFH